MFIHESHVFELRVETKLKCVTLIVTGKSSRSLAFHFRISRPGISYIVTEASEAIAVKPSFSAIFSPNDTRSLGLKIGCGFVIG